MTSSEFITFLAFALDASDKYTSGHSQRVSDITVEISRKFGMESEQIEKLKLAALVHDIGKLGIDEDILMKRDSLTKEEYFHVSAHSAIGEYLLSSAIEDEEILGIVRSHHERYDGTGYPDGLSGEDIPLGARILAVADTYDAMTSDRPYRKALGHRVTVTELQKQAGLQLDPVVVDVFSGIADENGLSIPEETTATVHT